VNVLSVTDLSKSYGGRTLLDGVSFVVDEGEKVGFIGANGTGKSTLFRLVAGIEGADAGEIAVRRHTRVQYLPQEPELTPGHTILYAVAEGRPELVEAAAAYEETSRLLAVAGSDRDRLLHRHAELGATLDRLGGWDWTHRVEAMLTRLAVADWDRSVGELSGGEAKRVALARTLLAQPELLLLDEPTNHLDADTVLFLEEYLMEYPGAVMLITHDRYFLDRVVDRMIELAAGTVTSFSGGYTDYLEEQSARTERLAVADTKRRRLLEQELAWARRAPPARSGKQRGRLKRAATLAAQTQAAADARTGAFRIHAPETRRLGRSVLELRGVSKAYDGRVLIRDFDARLRAGERVGVIGPNGAGKTTLIRIILGDEPVDEGVVEIGTNTRIAYFDQLRSQLEPESSVYDAVGGTDWIEVGGRRMHVRSYLEDFLFPTERQDQKVGSLSGGERNRLMLARLFLEPSNLLILDEPTNDLDLVTLQVLESAITDYDGCVLMVTHDRFFLDKVATALFVFEGDGVVHRHEGGFELYRRLRERRDAEAPRPVGRERAPAHGAAGRTATAQAAPADPAAAVSETTRKLTWREQRELESLESRIEEAEALRDALAGELAEPALYQDTARAARTVSAYDEARGTVDALYARWAELAARAG
jgi:ABC transport system ATP-binding/permease protein